MAPQDAYAEDNDAKFLRALATSLVDLELLLPQLLWKETNSGGELTLHKYCRDKDVARIVSKVDPFQDDPQLLDTHLKDYLPPLIAAYLQTLKQPPAACRYGATMPLHRGICKILYIFCKVRGEKVVIGFLNNEPKYFEPLLKIFEDGTYNQEVDGNPQEDVSLSWEEKYVLLLWLSHQMLAPFDLASISSETPPYFQASGTEIQLPASLPGIARRMIPLCLLHLEAATRERSAAAMLLVRLCLRPDMRKLGLLDLVLSHVLQWLQVAANEQLSPPRTSGFLLFIAKLTRSAKENEIGPHITTLHAMCEGMLVSDEFASIRVSAIARKAIIKTLRSVVLLGLHSRKAYFDIDSAIEEVVGHLLDSVADSDTPVRFAASKALSLITMSLPISLAGEVVEALLGALDEDIVKEGPLRSYSAVNPLRWHGLTLTLGHLLFRQIIPPDRLPEILEALLLALNFEQRSATGSSIGGNVRDAANFAIWALARRYTTTQLTGINIATRSSVKSVEQSIAVLQRLALELLQSACFDPVGNVRRGSSAALQELIGRHPDTIVEGISLVQIVDYQAVGLRGRAMMQVGVAAARLDRIYWTSMLDAALGWRGIGSVDASSRAFAGRAVGLLSGLTSLQDTSLTLDTIMTYFNGTTTRDIEERHGLVMALASLIETLDETLIPEQIHAEYAGIEVASKTFSRLMKLWTTSPSPLQTPEINFTSAALRPELTAVATCSLLAALSRLSVHSRSLLDSQGLPDTAHGMRVLDLCLQRPEDSIMEMLKSTISPFAELLSPVEMEQHALAWLSNLKAIGSLSSRKTGHLLALGTVFPFISNETVAGDILSSVFQRCGAAASVEQRVLAFSSLDMIVKAVLDHANYPALILQKIGESVLTGLNDYTINERGDIGSLVRLQALQVVQTIWSSQDRMQDDLKNTIAAAVVRLSLERLDKIRVRATQCLCMGRSQFTSLADLHLTDVPRDTSSYAHFRTALDLLRHQCPAWLQLAVIEGVISSAGLGSEGTIKVVRQALCDALVTSSSMKAQQDVQLLFATSITSVLRENLSSDRVLIPLLETLAYILDMRLLYALKPRPNAVQLFKWPTLFTLVQKCHFKSSNLSKIILALDVYRGLATVQNLRSDVVKKLVSMLLHPFPKVRVQAAESLFLVLGREERRPLRTVDWSGATKDLKPVVEKIRAGTT